MKRKKPGITAVRGFAGIAAILATVVPAIAHHSHAMFDLDAEQTIVGDVKAFVFANPHVYLYVNVPDPKTAVSKTYLVEMSHVQNMISRGIKASTFKAGDHVTVTINPLRDGRPGGTYVSIIARDGKPYGGREEAASALADEYGDKSSAGKSN